MDAARIRRWTKVGFGVGVVLLIASVASWFFGPAQHEDAIMVRLMITAVAFMVLVGSLVGWIATSEK